MGFLNSGFSLNGSGTVRDVVVIGDFVVGVFGVLNAGVVVFCFLPGFLVGFLVDVGVEAVAGVAVGCT